GIFHGNAAESGRIDEHGLLHGVRAACQPVLPKAQAESQWLVAVVRHRSAGKSGAITKSRTLLPAPRPTPAIRSFELDATDVAIQPAMLRRGRTPAAAARPPAPGLAEGRSLAIENRRSRQRRAEPEPGRHRRQSRDLDWWEPPPRGGEASAAAYRVLAPTAAN